MKTSGLFAFLSLFAAGLVASAHDSLPLGDKDISSSPQVGHLFSCQTEFDAQRAGARMDVPWIQGDVWYPDEKPQVQGDVTWPDASISVTVEGGRRVIRANGLPKHVTGVFPIRQSDPAYRYDRNPNAIREQQILLSLPAQPTAAASPSCLPMGMIGFALDGVAIFNGVDAGGRDAVAHEVQDACNGHPQQEGQYHYHGPSPCLKDPSGDAGRHSDLVGYALDGYGIYGEHGEGGKLLHDSDLDACHGHTHAVMWDGKLQVIYHYHLTPEYPYTLGCFHGSLDPSLLQRFGPGASGNGPPMGGANAQEQRGMDGPPNGAPDMDRQAHDAALQRAAASLGISPGRLRAALGPPPPDFARAAQILGISEQALRDALRQAHDQGPTPP